MGTGPYTHYSPSSFMNTLSESAQALVAALPEPVAPSDRLGSVDILRGVALLGILLMNIPFFALPEALVYKQVFTSPPNTNSYTFQVISVLFERKMRGFFSLLFGGALCCLWNEKKQVPGEDWLWPSCIPAGCCGWLCSGYLMRTFFCGRAIYSTTTDYSVCCCLPYGIQPPDGCCWERYFALCLWGFCSGGTSQNSGKTDKST
jgi:hypothetical protein